MLASNRRGLGRALPLFLGERFDRLAAFLRKRMHAPSRRIFRIMTHDFYAQPGKMTSMGKLPGDVASLARMVQGLVIHEYMTKAYGVTVPESRKAESHIRYVDEMLDRIFELDPSPLTVARPPEKRLVGVCHHFSLLFVAMLRAQGIPARYRQGFGTYFNPPNAEEHVVGEYWNGSRWVMVDPQLDDVWRRALNFDFDPLDVPHDRFIIAGDAWQQCRAGKADPGHYGIFVGNLRGLWFIAAEIIRDVSALNAVEMLPWDVWGAMPQVNEPMDARLAYFDQLAALTQSDALDAIRTRYESDPGLRVPSTVFNAVRNRPERLDRMPVSSPVIQPSK